MRSTIDSIRLKGEDGDKCLVSSGRQEDLRLADFVSLLCSYRSAADSRHESERFDSLRLASNAMVYAQKMW